MQSALLAPCSPHFPMLSGVKTGGRAQHTSGLQEAISTIHQAIWLIQTHGHVPQNKFLLQRARALPDPSHHGMERVSSARPRWFWNGGPPAAAILGTKTTLIPTASPHQDGNSSAHRHHLCQIAHSIALKRLWAEIIHPVLEPAFGQGGHLVSQGVRSLQKSFCSQSLEFPTEYRFSAPVLTGFYQTKRLQTTWGRPRLWKASNLWWSNKPPRMVRMSTYC